VSTFTKITTGVLAGATLMVAAAPAEAQWGHLPRGDPPTFAIGACALGLGVGLALSNRNRGWYGDRWDRGYYGRPYAYGYGSSYYGRPGWGGYDGWYGAPRARCWRERVWDDWRGRWRRVRVCDRF
jgi:hypothetical protein